MNVNFFKSSFNRDSSINPLRNGATQRKKDERQIEQINNIRAGSLINKSKNIDKRPTPLALRIEKQIKAEIKKMVDKTSTTIEKNGEEVKGKMPFNQHEDLSTLPDTLNQVVVKFGGLCELICNKVLMDNLLEGKHKEGKNFLKENVNVEALRADSIKKSHLLDVYPVFYLIGAFLFNIFPDNIFSNREQSKLVEKKKVTDTEVNYEVNADVLEKGLARIENGKTLKLIAFKKTKFRFQGHSLLVKKLDNDKYTFFDPDDGLYENLSFKELKEKIDGQLKIDNRNGLFFTRGDVYLNRLRNQKISKVAKKNIA